MTKIIHSSIWSVVFGWILATNAFAQPIAGRMLIRISADAVASVGMHFLLWFLMIPISIRNNVL